VLTPDQAREAPAISWQGFVRLDRRMTARTPAALAMLPILSMSMNDEFVPPEARNRRASTYISFAWHFSRAGQTERRMCPRPMSGKLPPQIGIKAPVTANPGSCFSFQQS